MNTSRIWTWAVWGIGSSTATTLAQGFILVPVGATGGHQIVGDQIFLDTPEQRVFLEVRIFGWDADLDGTPRLKSWQTVLISGGYSSGTRGTLGPAVQSCTAASDCTTAFGHGSLCDQAGGTLCAPAFIDTDRSDYVFAAPSASLPAVDLSSLDYRWASLILSSPVPDDGTPKYAGTLVLDVPADAAGTFTIPLDPGRSQILDEGSTFIEPLTTFSARITIRCQCAASCIDCNLNCIEDADDIANGTSQDLDEDGVPDECVAYAATGGDNLWSNGNNWDSGTVPDNGSATFSPTLSGSSATACLDTSVTLTPFGSWIVQAWT